MTTQPLVLDFDGSVLPLTDAEQRLALSQWQEAIRFGAGNAAFARFERRLNAMLPARYGCVFTGSGDFHHISLPLLRRCLAAQRAEPGSVDLVVCDNHPDNMRYVFGLHCGSWVRRAALLDAVRHVHVVGVTSADIAAASAWQNYLGPFVRKKLTYWSVGVDSGWLRCIGRGAYGKNFASPEALLEELEPVLRGAKRVYLSIDKDVLDARVVRTNWDQGVFASAHLERIIAACSGRLCGADVCGDMSSYRFSGRLKRFLAGLDGLDADIDEHELCEARKAHRLINRQLARLLRPAAIQSGIE